MKEAAGSALSLWELQGRPGRGCCTVCVFAKERDTPIPLSYCPEIGLVPCAKCGMSVFGGIMINIYIYLHFSQ